MKKQHLTLTDSDRTTLEQLLAKGTLPVKTFKRATALLELDRGKTLAALATTLDVDYNTVAAWRNGYTSNGLACLNDAPRSGRPIVIDGTQRATITALACSDAPEGHARWTLRLLAEKVVEAGVCDHVSHTFVGEVLKKPTEAAPAAHLVYR
jgi:putative transposase